MTTAPSPEVFDPPLRPVALYWSLDDLPLLEAEAREVPWPEPERFDRAVPKRRAEFLAGRWCARTALRACGCEAPVGAPTEGRRAPLWPEGFVGSITHTEGFAAAVVALRRDVRAVGLDVERIMTARTAVQVEGHVLTVSERAGLAGAAVAVGLDREACLTVLFSVKETVFKCLHPLAGVYLGFQDVAVELSGPEQGRFQAKLLRPAGEFAAGAAFRGRWHCAPPWVQTGLALLA